MFECCNIGGCCNPKGVKEQEVNNEIEVENKTLKEVVEELGLIANGCFSLDNTRTVIIGGGEKFSMLKNFFIKNEVNKDSVETISYLVNNNATEKNKVLMFFNKENYNDDTNNDVKEILLYNIKQIEDAYKMQHDINININNNEKPNDVNNLNLKCYGSNMNKGTIFNNNSNIYQNNFSQYNSKVEQEQFNNGGNINGDIITNINNNLQIGGDFLNKSKVENFSNLQNNNKKIFENDAKINNSNDFNINNDGRKDIETNQKQEINYNSNSNSNYQYKLNCFSQEPNCFPGSQLDIDDNDVDMIDEYKKIERLKLSIKDNQGFRKIFSKYLSKIGEEDKEGIINQLLCDKELKIMSVDNRTDCLCQICLKGEDEKYSFYLFKQDFKKDCLIKGIQEMLLNYIKDQIVEGKKIENKEYEELKKELNNIISDELLNRMCSEEMYYITYNFVMDVIDRIEKYNLDENSNIELVDFLITNFGKNGIKDAKRMCRYMFELYLEGNNKDNKWQKQFNDKFEKLKEEIQKNISYAKLNFNNKTKDSDKWEWKIFQKGVNGNMEKKTLKMLKDKTLENDIEIIKYLFDDNAVNDFCRFIEYIVYCDKDERILSYFKKMNFIDDKNNISGNGIGEFLNKCYNDNIKGNNDSMSTNIILQQLEKLLHIEGTILSKFDAFENRQKLLDDKLRYYYNDNDDFKNFFMKIYNNDYYNFSSTALYFYKVIEEKKIYIDDIIDEVLKKSVSVKNNPNISTNI